MNKKTMYNLTYGLFVLTSAQDGRDGGCIINTAGQATSEPNRISIAVNKANFTHDLVKNSKRFNISILSEVASFDTFKRFGFQSGRTVDKFAGFSGCERSANGLYYVTAGTNGYISGEVEQAIDLGSHTLFIAGYGCAVRDYVSHLRILSVPHQAKAGTAKGPREDHLALQGLRVYL